MIYKIRKINRHTHFLTLFSKSIRKFIKKGYDPFKLQLLHVWLSIILQLAVMLYSFHARRQECLSTLWWSPPQLWKRKVVSLLFCYFCRTVLLVYSDCCTIMEWTGDRWIQFVRFKCVFVIHSTKILKGHRYISHRVYAMTLQLWHPVLSSCFDDFQQHLQEVLSKF